MVRLKNGITFCLFNILWVIPLTLTFPITANIQVDLSNKMEIIDPAIFGTTVVRNDGSQGYVMMSTAQFGIGEVLFQDEGPFNPNLPNLYNFASFDTMIVRLYAYGSEPLIMFNLIEAPSSYSNYSIYVSNVLRHYTEGWNNGFFFPVRYVRFGNEPDGGNDFWSGTTAEFFQTYQTVAGAVKAVNPNFILAGPGLRNAVIESTNTPNTYAIQFLNFCRNNNVPLDIFSFHAYNPNLYRRYNKNFVTINNYLSNYSTLSPIYGKPLLANDEWNLALGDFFTGSYAEELDTAWAAAHNAAGLMLMIHAGVKQSIRYGGPFIATDGQHDFNMVNYPDYSPKPIFWGMKAVNSLANANRLPTVGYDSVNLAVISGMLGEDTVRVAIANFDTREYLETYVMNTLSGSWAQYRSIKNELGLEELHVYDNLQITLNNPPWSTNGNYLQVKHYLINDTEAFTLISDQDIPLTSSVTLNTNTNAPSVHLYEIIRRQNPTNIPSHIWQNYE